MQKSYVAKTTINFIDYEFYIRPGDILVHDPSNDNRLTVYRNGAIVKIAKQDPIGIQAFLKNKFIEEVGINPAPKPVVAPSKPVTTPEPSPTATDAPEAKPEPKRAVKKARQDEKEESEVKA